MKVQSEQSLIQQDNLAKVNAIGHWLGTERVSYDFVIVDVVKV